MEINQWLNDLRKILNTFNWQFYLVLPTNNDWDSYGACVTIYLILKKLKKSAKIVWDLKIQDNYKKIFNIWEINTNIVQYEIEKIFIIFDCSTIDLIWQKLLDNLKNCKNKKIINIDHHITNKLFWDLNIVPKWVSSTCEVIYKIIEYCWFEKIVNKTIASLLLMWIYFDTSWFRNSWTNQNSFLVWSKLMKYWANHEKVVKSMYNSLSLNEMKAYWIILNSIKLYKNWKILWAFLMYKEIKKLNLDKNLVDFWMLKNDILPSLSICEYVFFIKEFIEWEYNISFRSKSDKYDVSKIAQVFWGWWHKRSSWATVFKTNFSLEQVIEKITNFYL